MINKDKAEALLSQKYTSSVLKNLKDFFSDLFSSTFSKTLSVKVENINTKLEKETAENTRGLKGRLDKLIEKEIVLTKIEEKLDYLTESINKRLDTIAAKEVIIEEIKVSNFPEIVNEVKIKNLPEPIKEIKVSNLSDIKFPEVKIPDKPDFSSLEKLLSDLKSSFSKVSDYLPELKQKEFPKIEIPKQTSIKEAKEIVKSIKDLEKTISDDLLALSTVIKAQEAGMTTNERGEVEVKVSNFPPQHIPTPVTNININSLRGVPLSTVVQVGTTATKLPEDPISQRRSLIIFNNSGNTIYLGGSNVTTSNGFPVIDQQYSPPIDAGEHMDIYGIAGSADNEVRVFEVSSDQEGN